MDLFTKALKKGVVKTLEVGQQQLQQRLAKFEQQNGGANSHGSASEQQQSHNVQYGSYGYQGSYQNTTHAGGPQSMPYFPPPPTAGQQLHSHVPPGSDSYGQAGSPAVLTGSSPSLTQSPGAYRPAYPNQHYNTNENAASHAFRYHGSSANVTNPPASTAQSYGSYQTSGSPQNKHEDPGSMTYQLPPPIANVVAHHSYQPPGPQTNVQYKDNHSGPYQATHNLSHSEQQVVTNNTTSSYSGLPNSESTSYKPGVHSGNAGGHASFSDQLPHLTSSQLQGPLQNDNQNLYNTSTPPTTAPPSAQQNDYNQSFANAQATSYHPPPLSSPNPAQMIQKHQQPQVLIAPQTFAEITSQVANSQAHPLTALARPCQDTIPVGKPNDAVQSTQDRAASIESTHNPATTQITPATDPSIVQGLNTGYGYSRPNATANTVPVRKPLPGQSKQSMQAAATGPNNPGPTPNAIIALNSPHHQSPAQDDTSFVAEQLDNLRIVNEHKEMTREDSRGQIGNAKRHKLFPIVANGPPQEVVRFCPENRQVNYSLYWHYLPDLPEYLICTRCFVDNIESTALANKFKRTLVPEGSQSTCRFWYPRVKDVLWKEALHRGRLDDIQAFMLRRSTIPNCKGRKAVRGKEGIKWFGMLENDVNGFVACEACYEDHIMGTSFQPKFAPRDDQGAEDEWICDVALSYVSLALKEFSRKNDWSAFIDGSTRRFNMPVCEGKSVSSTAGPWYVTRRQIEDLRICEACYMDKLALTPFADEFELVTRTGGFDQFMELLGQTWICKLASTNIPMAFVLDALTSDEDFDAFWNSAQALNKLVPCTANGIIRGNWWTVAGGCADFSICEACYTGIFQVYDVGKFLEPAKRSSEATIVCNFCTSSPRFNQFFSSFVEALDRSVLSYFVMPVKKFAHVQPCPRINHCERAKWWGYAEALFCEDCYVSFVADTPLGDKLQIQGEYDERAQICQVWSPRMRGMWMEACQSEDGLAKFKAFGEQRLQIYLQTVPRIKFIMGMREIKMMNAMQQGQLSLMYQGMNSQAVLSGTGDGYLHGSNSLGWYETEHGATGAQMFNNMQAGFADASRPDEWMEMSRLEMMWNEVE